MLHYVFNGLMNGSNSAQWASELMKICRRRQIRIETELAAKKIKKI